MKRFVFFKQVDDIQLGHLYEHVFLDCLGKNLRELGYLSFLDYDSSGETFGIGAIVLKIDVYNAGLARNLMKIFENLKVDFTDGNIQIALDQICAEKESDADCDFDVARSLLDEIEAQQWQDLSLYDNLIGRQDIPYDNCLHLKAKKNSPKDICVDVKIDLTEENYEIASLFLFVGRLISHNVCELCESELGMFNVEASVEGDVEHIIAHAVLRQHEPIQDTQKIKEITQKVLKDVQTPENLTKIADFFKGHSYNDARDWFASPIEIIEEYGVLPGGYKWKNIATQSNLTSIIKQIDFKIHE